MPLGPSMKRELSDPNKTRFHTEMLHVCQNYIDNSLTSVSQFFSRWDKARDAYEAKIEPRTSDEQAYDEERPQSQSIPMTYSQIKTFQAFAASVLSQRPRQFEHAPGGPEDAAMIELSELLLDQDMTHNRWKTKRGQILQMFGLYGLAAVHTGFCENVVGLTYETSVETGTVSFGQSWANVPKLTTESVTTYKGNDITVISPYRYLPDPAFDLCDQHKARFQGHEFEISRQELKAMEARNEVAGVDLINNTFARDRWEKRSTRYHQKFEFFRNEDKQTEIIVITALQLKLIPASIKLLDKSTLGDSTAPTIINVWIANDDRIIKCEISGHLHGKFCYDVAAFDNEKHVLLGKSIAEMMNELQSTADWFLNSKVETVTRNVEPQLVYDPYSIETADLINGERLIRMKKGATRFGMDTVVKQLQVADTTSRHMDDIAQINRIIYEVTGINANMTGQFHSGRRSATEAKVVSGGAASRIITWLAEVWESLFTPMGSKCNTNLRQGLTPEDILLRAGQRDPAIIAQYKADPVALARSMDLWIMDSTTPSEKGFQAQWLQEMFSIVMSNPMAAIQLDLSPRLILEKGMELQGITFRENLKLSNDPATLQQVVMQMAQQMAQQMIAQQLMAQPPAPPPSNGPPAA